MSRDDVPSVPSAFLGECLGTEPSLQLLRFGPATRQRGVADNVGPIEADAAVENSSQIKDTVLDPFAGSGTTLIA
jgi:hypothetical protein